MAKLRAILAGDYKRGGSGSVEGPKISLRFAQYRRAVVGRRGVRSESVLLFGLFSVFSSRPPGLLRFPSLFRCGRSPFGSCRALITRGYLPAVLPPPRRGTVSVPAFDARSRAMLARNRSRNRAQHPKIAQAGIPRLCPSHISPKPRPRAALCTRTRRARAASTLPQSHPDTADTQGAPHLCAADAARAPRT